MTLEELAKQGLSEKNTEVVLYFDKDHEPVENEDDAIITEIFKFDDKGVITDHETIEKPDPDLPL
jgi:hypothetical protein